MTCCDLVASCKIEAEAKKKSWEEFGKEIEESFHENNKNFWTPVKHLRGNMRKKVRSVKDKNGQLLTNTDKILETWSEH